MQWLPYCHQVHCKGSLAEQSFLRDSNHNHHFENCIHQWMSEGTAEKNNLISWTHTCIFMFVCVNVSLEMLMVFWCRWIQGSPNCEYKKKQEALGLHGNLKPQWMETELTAMPTHRQPN
jgi:hypothetical protein